jgi:hypothetical protein
VGDYRYMYVLSNMPQILSELYEALMSVCVRACTLDDRTTSMFPLS